MVPDYTLKSAVLSKSHTSYTCSLDWTTERNELSQITVTSLHPDSIQNECLSGKRGGAGHRSVQGVGRVPQRRGGVGAVLVSHGVVSVEAVVVSVEAVVTAVEAVVAAVEAAVAAVEAVAVAGGKPQALPQAVVARAGRL